MARIGDRKSPINGRLLRVALVFPGRDFTLERCFVGDAAIEALLLEDAQFDLGHVQPTPMLGGIMKLELPGDPPRLGRLKRFLQRRDLMRIEIVQHDANHRGFGVAFIHQPLHRVGEVELRPLRRHLHMPPTRLRLHEEKEVARAVAFVFVVIALQPPRLGEHTRDILERSCGIAPRRIDELLARKVVLAAQETEHA